MAPPLKRLSTSFKVILILSAILIVAYLAKLFTGTKQVVLPEPVTATAAIVKKHTKKHHPKKHLPLSEPIQPVADTAIAVVTKSIETKAEPSSTKILPVKKIADTTATTTTFLYTTYVQPNVTGVVKLRQHDNFYSNSIADIPANARVGVLAKGATYYRVSYNNSVGFVPRWALQIK